MPAFTIVILSGCVTTVGASGTMENNQAFWIAVRRALLIIVDAIERHVLCLEEAKRTSVLRKRG